MSDGTITFFMFTAFLSGCLSTFLVLREPQPKTYNDHFIECIQRATSSEEPIYIYMCEKEAENKAKCE